MRMTRYVSGGYDRPPVAVWECPACDRPAQKADLSESLKPFPMTQPKGKQ
jgi:hypothetical protein